MWKYASADVGRRFHCRLLLSWVQGFVQQHIELVNGSPQLKSCQLAGTEAPCRLRPWLGAGISTDQSGQAHLQAGLWFNESPHPTASGILIR
jgi:hypothetical protein